LDLKNKILLGDCIDIMKTFESNSVDLILTDPPYNLFSHKIEKKVNIKEFIFESHRVLKENSFFIYFGQQPSITNWNKIAMRLFKYKAEFIWYKRNNTNICNDYLRVFENIMIFQKGHRRFNEVKRKYSDVKMSLSEFVETATIQRAFSEIRAFETKKGKQLLKNYIETGDYPFERKQYNDTLNFRKSLKKKHRLLSSYDTLTKGTKPQNLISFMPFNKVGYNKKETNVNHPTTKSLLLMEYLILLSSKENDLILDSFLGSGTTALACLRTNRNYCGIEILPEYYEMSNKRIETELKIINGRLI